MTLWYVVRGTTVRYNCRYEASFLLVFLHSRGRSSKWAGTSLLKLASTTCRAGRLADGGACATTTARGPLFSAHKGQILCEPRGGGCLV